MTAQAATDADVGDNILGKLARTFADLIGRIVKGTTDPARAKHIMSLATQNFPDPRPSDAFRSYVVEYEWTFDSRNREYVTITFERKDGLGFEALLDDSVDKAKTLQLMNQLERLLNEVTPSHGSRRIIRLYRIRRCSRFTLVNSKEDTIKRSCDLHFELDPICDFKKSGRYVGERYEPVPTSEESDRL